MSLNVGTIVLCLYTLPKYCLAITICNGILNLVGIIYKLDVSNLSNIIVKNSLTIAMSYLGFACGVLTFINLKNIKTQNKLETEKIY